MLKLVKIQIDFGTNSTTVTAEYFGAFLEPERRDELLKYLNPK